MCSIISSSCIPKTQNYHVDYPNVLHEMSSCEQLHFKKMLMLKNIILAINKCDNLRPRHVVHVTLNNTNGVHLNLLNIMFVATKVHVILRSFAIFNMGV